MATGADFIQAGRAAVAKSQREIASGARDIGSVRLHSGAALPVTTSDVIPTAKFGVAAFALKGVGKRAALPVAKAAVSSVWKRIFGGTVKERAGRAAMGLGAYTLADYAVTGNVPIPTPRRVAGFAGVALNPVSAAIGAFTGGAREVKKEASTKIGIFADQYNTEKYWKNYWAQFNKSQGQSTAYGPGLGVDAIPEWFKDAALGGNQVFFNFPEQQMPSYSGGSATYAPQVSVNPSVGAGMGFDPALLMIMMGLGLGGGYLLGKRSKKRRKRKKRKN